MMPINRPVRVVTKDGTVINGRRLNEDTYGVQLIDDHERLHSLVKADLREYTIARTSPMPPFKGKLSRAESRTSSPTCCRQGTVAMNRPLWRSGWGLVPSAALLPLRIKAQVTSQRLAAAEQEPQNWLTSRATTPARGSLPSARSRPPTSRT